MQIRLNELFGLPAHSFLIHLVVVLLPFAAAAAVAVAVRSDWRHRYRPHFLVLAVFSVVGVWVVSGSGEELHDALKADDPDVFKDIPSFKTHEDRGRAMIRWANLFGIAVVLMFGLDWFARRSSGSGGDVDVAGSGAEGAMRLALLGARVLLVAAALWAAYLLVLTGHSGAQSVWG